MTKREIVLVAVVVFLLGVIACHTAVQQIKPAQAETTPWTGKKFEQKCEHIERNPYLKANISPLNDFLREQAKYGWRLVSVAGFGTAAPAEPYFCFIREL